MRESQGRDVEEEDEQKEAKEERERGKNPELDNPMKGWSPRSPFPQPNIVHKFSPWCAGLGPTYPF